MTLHDLKTWPEHFEMLRLGLKTFELRRDDRGYAAGDDLLLREWDPATRTYTGRMLTAVVTHLLRGPEALRFGLRAGYVVLSIPHVTEPLDCALDDAEPLTSYQQAEPTRWVRTLPEYGTPERGIPMPTGLCPTCMGEQELPQFTSDPVIRGGMIIQSGAELRACPQCGGRERFGYAGPDGQGQ